MSEIAAFSLESPITALRDLLLGHEPPIHARMTEPDYSAKYLRIHTPITDSDLAAPCDARSRTAGVSCLRLCA